jgi:hypothetical protein
MNITEGTSGVTTAREEERKTFDQWLNEADSLYRQCSQFLKMTPNGEPWSVEYWELVNKGRFEITEKDDAPSIVLKANSILELENNLKRRGAFTGRRNASRTR